MSTTSPLYFLESLARGLAERLPVPDWMVEESQRRIVLLLNHVLQQEPAAIDRLLQVQGSVLLVHWQAFSLRLAVTPAGLLDLAQELRARGAPFQRGRLAAMANGAQSPETRISP